MCVVEGTCGHRSLNTGGAYLGGIQSLDWIAGFAEIAAKLVPGIGVRYLE